MRHNRSEYIANLQLSPRGSLPIAQPLPQRARVAIRAHRRAQWAARLQLAGGAVALALTGLSLSTL